MTNSPSLGVSLHVTGQQQTKVSTMKSNYGVSALWAGVSTPTALASRDVHEGQ
jgi:hypothetical protein